jgi:hypothetical protein
MLGAKQAGMARNLVCSFCQKTEHQVAKLVAGPNVFICDECVAIAAHLMGAPPRDPRPWARLRRRVRAGADRIRSYGRRSRRRREALALGH